MREARRVGVCKRVKREKYNERSIASASAT
jgi:hypothetical protein